MPFIANLPSVNWELTPAAPGGSQRWSPGPGQAERMYNPSLPLRFRAETCLQEKSSLAPSDGIYCPRLSQGQALSCPHLHVGSVTTICSFSISLRISTSSGGKENRRSQARILTADSYHMLWQQTGPGDGLEKRGGQACSQGACNPRGTLDGGVTERGGFHLPHPRPAPGSVSLPPVPLPLSLQSCGCLSPASVTRRLQVSGRALSQPRGIQGVLGAGKGVGVDLESGGF